MNKVEIKPMSVNKAWQGRRFKTEDYKNFERSLLFLLPRIKIPEGELKISFVWGFSNMGSDADNPCKPTMDVMQKKYGFNDSRVIEINLKKQKVPKGSEFIKFKVEKFI